MTRKTFNSESKKKLDVYLFHSEDLKTLGFKIVGRAEEYGERAWRWENEVETIITWDCVNGWWSIWGKERKIMEKKIKVAIGKKKN